MGRIIRARVTWTLSVLVAALVQQLKFGLHRGGAGVALAAVRLAGLQENEKKLWKGSFRSGLQEVE